MDSEKLRLTQNKFKLPYHWMRDPLHRESLPYFGYARIILEELPPAPARVFDAGCADGRISRELVDAGYQVTGMELVENSVRYACVLVPEGEFMAGDLREDPAVACGLTPESYDAVVLVEVYEHIPPQDCPQVLANLAGLLKPGGTLIISAPSLLVPPSNLHYRHFAPCELEKEVSEAGFKVKKTVGQHRLDGISKWLLSDSLDRLLFNGLLEPRALAIMRKKLYMKRCNRVAAAGQCGRFIVVSQKA